MKFFPRHLLLYRFADNGICAKRYEKTITQALQNVFASGILWWVCCLSIFSLESILAQNQPLRILQPNRGERLTPGGEYLIIWAGGSILDTFQLSFSTNGGKSWQLITSAATGSAFQWRPIPSSISDSCILAISNKTRDNSSAVQSNAFGLRYGQARSSQRWLNRWSGFTFDGAKILTISSFILPNVSSDDSARQAYRTEVWEASSGRLLYSLPDVLADTVLRFAPTGLTPQSIQAQWSPDNTKLLNILSDSTFGIFDANKGNLLRSVNIPKEGFRTALQTLAWSTDGQEIIARILYRTQGTGSAGSIILDKFVRFGANDSSNRPLGSQFSTIEFDKWGSTYLGLMNNKQQWLAMKRGGETAQTQELLLYTAGQNVPKRFSAPNNYVWRPETVLVSPNDAYITLIAEAANKSSNLPNLLAIITLQTEALRTLSAARPISWSGDSRKLLILNENTTQTEIFDAETFSTIARAQNLYAPLAERSVSMGNITSDVRSSNEGIRWNNDGRSILGYESVLPNNWLVSSTNAQALGRWDAESGCQFERFALPRLPGMNQPLNYNANLVGTIVTNTSERQYIINNRSSDTALVLTLPAPGVPCQTAVSNGLWAIRLPNLIVAPETVTFPTLICESTTTAQFSLTNLTSSALVIESTLQNLTERAGSPLDFTFEQSVSNLLRGGSVQTIVVRYTPQGFGSSSAQFIVTDFGKNVILRTTLLARRDSLAFDPPAPTVNLGIIPANTIITTTFTVRNTGNTPLIWTTAATRSSQGNIFITSITPNPTPAGSTAQIRLRLQPVASQGNFREMLPIYFCGSSTSTAFVQARVLSEFPQLVIPPLIDGGLLTCERSTTRTIRIQNTGGKPLNITSIGVMDENFTILNPPVFPLNIQPLDSLVLTMVLSTSTEGIRESSLFIRSNDATRALAEITLRLEKRTPRYTWLPALLRFERIDIDTSVERTVEFLNTSSSPYFWSPLPRQITPDFTILSVQPNPTPNGSTSRVTIRFGGSPISGLISTTAVFNLRDICNTDTQLNLEAVIVQPAPKVIVRSTIAFDTLLCDTERTQTVEILNAGRTALRIDSMFVESGIGAGRSNATDFMLRSDSLPAFPVRIAGVDSASIPLLFPLQFRPRAIGFRENWLVIYSNDTTNRNGITRVRLTGVRDTAGFTFSRPIVNFPALTDFTPARDSIILTNIGTKPLQWQGFPRIIDSLFIIERIEPAITPPLGGKSTVYVLFAGIRSSANLTREFPLTNPLCNTAQILRFSAGTAPQALLDAISNVNRRLLCEQEQRIALPLRNLGNAPLTFPEQPRFLNDVLNEVRILSVPGSIAPLGLDSLVLQVRPQSKGTRTLRLQITSNDIVTPRREVLITFTKDSSSLRFVPEAIEIGSVNGGTPLIRSITIENTGTIEQLITTPFQTNILTVESLSPNPIPPGASANAQVRLIPTTNAAVNGTVTGRFTIQDSCARQSGFTLTARLTDGEFSLPDSVQLAPLGTVDMPIFLRRRTGFAPNTTATFAFRIANTSLVEVVSPKDPSQGVLQNRVENGVRTMIFRVIIPSTNESEPLVTMSLRGLLGNDSLTTLTIDSAFVGSTPLRGAQSRFRTVGLNYAGGKPLYFTPLVRLVAPNPASEELSVTIETPEPAEIILRIFNVLGQATPLFTGRVEAGEKEFRFSVAALPVGTYILELRASNLRNPAILPERSTTRIQIVR